LTFAERPEIVLGMAPEPSYNPPSAPLATEKIRIDRKIFFVDLKENQRGRFLKITEDVGGRRDTIMLPLEVLPEFLESLRRLAEFEAALPPAE
jgi:hypothetical protein